MTLRTAEPSPLTRARLAAFLSFLGLPAPFGLIYVPARLIVPGDAAATANNIIASESLFRLGILSNLLLPILNILLAVALYQLLKPVNKTMAWLMVIFVLAGVPIAMLSELTQLAALRLVSGMDYLTVFTTAQLQALVLLCLQVHQQGLNIAMLFWGLWLFPLGYLVFKSGFLPRPLGLLLILGCVGYMAQSLAALLVPGLRLNLIFLTSWGELLLPFWLLIKGVNVEQWNKLALESA